MMADEQDDLDISPMFRRAHARAKQGFKSAPINQQQQQQQGTPQGFQPNPTPQGFWESFKASNPVSGVVSGIKEFINRPQAQADIIRAAAAGARIRAGKEQPGDRALLEKGMHANVGAPGQPPIVPYGSEPGLMATSQVDPWNSTGKIDPGGAAGTLVGAYGPIVAAEAPAIARTAAKGTKTGLQIAKETKQYAMEPVGETPLTYRGKGPTLTNPPRIVARTAQGATKGAEYGGKAGLLFGGWRPSLEGSLIGGGVGGAIGAGGVLVKGALRAAKRNLAEQVPRPAPEWQASPQPVDLPPPRVEPIASDLPSGRTPGGYQEQPPRPAPAWQGTPEPQEPPPPKPVEPIVTEPPSGRKAPTAEERMARAESAVAEKPPATPAGLDPKALDDMALALTRNKQKYADLDDAGKATVERIVRGENPNVPKQEPPPPPPEKPATPPEPETQPPAKEEPAPEEEESPLERQLRESIERANAKKDVVPKPEEEAPPPKPKPAEGGRLYSKTKNPWGEANSQLHATVTEADMPGSPPGHKPSMGAVVRDIYGPEKIYKDTTPGQLMAINEFVVKNNRPPTSLDVENGTFDPYPPEPAAGEFQHGGLFGGGEPDTPSRRIAQELKNQGLTSSQAETSITPEEWGELSRAAGVNVPGGYSIQDTIRHMRSLEGGMRAGGTVKPDSVLVTKGLPTRADILRYLKTERKAQGGSENDNIMNVAQDELLRSLAPTKQQVIQSLGRNNRYIPPAKEELPSAVAPDDSESDLSVPQVPRSAMLPRPVEKTLSGLESVLGPVGAASDAPVFNPLEQTHSLGLGIVPTNKTEALLLAAGLIPPGKFLKAAEGVVKGGTSLLEGGAPEATSIINPAGKSVEGFLANKGKTEYYYPTPAERLAEHASQLGIEDPEKGVAAALKDLRWREWEKPEAEQDYGQLRRSTYDQPILRRFQSTPPAIQQRIQKAEDLLSVPVEPWTPKDYGVFDRSLIKNALEGWPGVEQTAWQRKVAPKADLSYIDQIYNDPVNRDLIKRQITRGLPLGGETFYASLYPVKAEALSAGIPESQFNEWAHAVSKGSARNSLLAENAVGNYLMKLNKQGVPLTDENVKEAMAMFKKRYGVGLPLMPIHRQGVAGLLEQGVTPQDLLGKNLTESYKIPTYGMQKAGDFAKSWVGDVHEASGESWGTRYNPYFRRQGGFGGNEYGPAEQHFGSIANEMGLPWGMGQAGRWYGGGELTGLRSPRGDALDVLEKQAAYTMHNRGMPTDPASVRNYVLDLVRQGGELYPWAKQSEMPDYRTLR
jgi:hypothetical protein